MRLLASLLFLFFSQRVHAQSDSGVQGGYFAVSPPGDPEWRVRAIATFLFPTG